MAETQEKKASELTRTQKIEAKWNSFANVYSKAFAIPLLPVGLQLVSCLPIKEPSSLKLLEVACGDGRLAEQINAIHPGIQYSGFDLSKNMVDIAKLRVPSFSFGIGNAEDLQYADNTFDYYISSLCLMIVAHPEKMLSEAYRVLKPGGKAAISIWGPKDMSSWWNIVEAAHLGVGNKFETSKNFHLSNDNFKEFNEALSGIGFENRVQWNSDICMPVFEPEAVTKYWSVSKDRSDDVKAKFRQILLDGAGAELSASKPLSFAVTFIILSKPQVASEETQTVED